MTDQQLTPEQALNVVSALVARATGTLEDHRLGQQSLAVLAQLVQTEPEPEAEAPVKTQPRKKA